MSRLIEDTLNILEEARERSDSILVAFSGGKDSMVVLDLCKRTFKRVECFFMYFVPGLEHDQKNLDEASRRWDVKIRQYPHWTAGDALKYGVYCFSHFKNAEMPEWKLREVYSLAIADAGIPLIATGAKKTDSLWRKRSLSTTKWEDMVYPVVNWTKLDVLSYLKGRGIPLPERQDIGTDLSDPAVLWLYDHYPQDYLKLEAMFPFVGAIVKRREWYGEENHVGRKRRF